jgi:hypothetical protein
MTSISIGTIIQVDNTPAFLISYTTRYLTTFDGITQDTVSLIIAAYHPDQTDDQTDQVSPLPQLTLDQIWAIHHVLHGYDLDDPNFSCAPRF